MDVIPGADVLCVPVSFHFVDARRILGLFSTTRWLAKHVFSRATMDCDVYVDSLDLLTIAQLIGRGHGWRYRFEVRDLHPLQLGRGPLARIVQRVEGVLLRRVSTLVLTSREHYSRYYRTRFSGSPTFVENIPARRAWLGFRHEPATRFVIGFIGVLRYRRCLETLIDAVKRLNRAGMAVHLRLAGGGLVDGLRAYVGDAPFIEITGPFRYADSVNALFSDLSIINSVYDADDPNVRLAISNKFYEAQIGKIPVMVAEGTYLAELVREAGIGVAVRHLDVDDVAEKIADAYHARGWYATARAQLATVDPERLFEQHEAEVAAAVLGDSARFASGATEVIARAEPRR